MDAVLAHALSQITTLPPEAQRDIAVQLMRQDSDAALPVIEFEV